MRHIKTYESWGLKDLFKDIGSFTIKYQPTVDDKEDVRVFPDTTRKKAITELLSQFPTAKILSITKE